jgi:hypothetical protein
MKVFDLEVRQCQKVYEYDPILNESSKKEFDLIEPVRQNLQIVFDLVVRQCQKVENCLSMILLYNQAETRVLPDRTWIDQLETESVSHQPSQKPVRDQPEGLQG